MENTVKHVAKTNMRSALELNKKRETKINVFKGGDEAYIIVKGSNSLLSES